MTLSLMELRLWLPPALSCMSQSDVIFNGPSLHDLIHVPSTCQSCIFFLCNQLILEIGLNGFVYINFLLDLSNCCRALPRGDLQLWRAIYPRQTNHQL